MHKAPASAVKTQRETRDFINSLTLAVLQLPRQRALWRYHRSVKPIVMLMAAAAVIPNLDQLEQMSARFAPVRLQYDEAGLSSGDRKALPKLVEAARVLNFLFMDQLWSGDRALYEKLQKDATPLGKQRLHYFWLNKGPWSDLDGHTAFLPGVPERKPMGANFYPEDMKAAEFETWAKSLSKEQREQAEGFFTVIRRNGKQLSIV